MQEVHRSGKVGWWRSRTNRPADEARGVRRRSLVAVALAVACGVPAGAADLAAGATAPPRDCTRVTHGLDLETVTIPQLARALREGRISSVQLTRAYLQRIKAFDHGAVDVNAVRALTDDAIAQA